MNIPGVGTVTAGSLEVLLVHEADGGVIVRVLDVDTEPDVLGVRVERANGTVEEIPWPKPDMDTDPLDPYYEVFVPREVP